MTLLLSASHKDSVTASAAEIVESVAVRSSSIIYAYDVATRFGLGELAKIAKETHSNSPTVVSMQTRDGAGLLLAGRLSEGTSSEGSQDSFVLTALTTPHGLLKMAPAMASFPYASPSSRAVLNVSALGSLEGSMSLYPSLEQLAVILPIIPEQFTIILSTSPQEIVDMASAAYSITDSHVIHVFNSYDSARELRTLSYPVVPVPETTSSRVSAIEALQSLGYGLFDYYGHERSEDILVVLNGPLGSSLQGLVTSTSTIGLIVVRILRPWDGESFRKILPASAKAIHVLEEVVDEFVEGSLYNDVAASLFSPEKDVSLLSLPSFSHRISPNKLLGLIKSPQALGAFLSNAIPSQKPILPTHDAKKLVFIGTPASPLRKLPLSIAHRFLQSKSLHTRYLLASDLFSNPGGAEISRVVLAASNSPSIRLPFNSVFSIEASEGKTPATADFTAILDPVLLKTHDTFRYANRRSPVLVFTSMGSQELLGILPQSTKDIIAEQDLKLFIYNPRQTFGDECSLAAQEALAHIAFLCLYIGGNRGALIKISRTLLGAEVDRIPIDGLVDAVWNGLTAVTIAPEPNGAPGLSVGEPPDESLRAFNFNVVSLDGTNVELGDAIRNGPVTSAWHDAAKHMMFPEAFTAKSSPGSQVLVLRPEVPTKTYLITCTVNKRLTPLSYNRNVFHMEFDTENTGLTYKIGEALGIHGWNHEEDVLDFCRWYGVDADALISIPVPSPTGKQLMATRTVFQALQQNIDIFGKPPKSFFAALAKYAEDRRERMALLFISAAEGAATLKKLNEVDTVSYADVLQQYPSARPSIAELAMMVGDIKERHYSIASAQSVVGNRVDLLVVTIDWITPNGILKYGQCTRYLADLKPGTKVTVSIKPSVMKLPPSDLQPIIMAGLGTGAAPFRAFIQHRALQVNLGKRVGPMLYYFGSRHRSEEYLYGEEIEAYMKDNIITHAGLAFSRDSNSKVYIQHKMRNDGEMLANFMKGEGADAKEAEKGAFYLCGPTWPVPDVFEALVNALVKTAGRDKADAEAFLERLKEEERYVLEVY